LDNQTGSHIGACFSVVLLIFESNGWQAKETALSK
jgi:hypothetical protein